MGKPIKIPKIEKPTKEDVNQYHQIYMKSVRELFNRHVDKCDPGAKLVFDNELFKPKMWMKLSVFIIAHNYKILHFLLQY